MNRLPMNHTSHKVPELPLDHAHIQRVVDETFDPHRVMNAVNPYPPLSQRWFIFARYWAGKYHQP